MKTPLSNFKSPTWKVAGAAVLASVGLFGSAAVYAQQPGPVVGSQPPATAGPLTSPTQDILDIRAPYHVPAATPWAAWGGGALGVTALGACLWAFLRRRAKSPTELQIALEKLEAARPLAAEGQVEEFSQTVSETVRGFIEASLPVRAVHATTTEFFQNLARQENGPLTSYREELSEFLVHCDLAKFARWSFSAPQMEEMLASATTFVTAVGTPQKS